MIKSFVSLIIVILGLSLSATSILALVENAYPKGHEKRYKKIAIISTLVGIVISMVGGVLLFGK